jgi:hypothetical protein|tara:strand:- start:21 stop:248 length:228 start_codon:yes stop_codon:yes gene_type:complete
MGKCNALYQDVVQYVEDTRVYINSESTGNELEIDVSLIESGCLLSVDMVTGYEVELTPSEVESAFVKWLIQDGES